MPRRLFTGLCLLSVSLLSGCSFLDDFSGLFSDVQFVTKPVMFIPDRRQFEVGDVYVYQIGATSSEERATRVEGHNVWWSDNWGRRWLTDAGALLPPKEFQAGATSPKISRVSMESTGPLYPLLIGKSVAFRYAKAGGGTPKSFHSQECAIVDFGAVITKAGSFDVFKMNCSYDGDAFVNYFAPSIGRVVLQTGSSLFSSVERELVKFHPGGGRMAKTTKPTKQGAAMAPKMTPHRDSSHKPSMKKPTKTKHAKSPAAPMAAKRTSSGKFGVQLAAYEAAARARRAWTQIKKRAGALLSDRTPVIERHNGKSGSVYRLLVSGFSTKAKATAHCKALKRKRIDCWARALASSKASGHGAPARRTQKHSAAPRFIETASAAPSDREDTAPALLHFAKP
ncbi:MAG: cell division septation protein DedD [Alphaproteobacteria bacterium]|jgi:cell division septation protein DedD